MTTNRLDQIEARAKAATDGPWEAFGTTIGAMTGPGDCGGCSGIPSPAHEPSCYWSEIVEAGAEDAEFIAHARQDIDDLVAFVREVEALHQPKPDGVGDMHDAEGNYLGYGDISPACGTCGQHDEYAVPWPCPTARALDRLNGGA